MDVKKNKNKAKQRVNSCAQRGAEGVPAGGNKIRSYPSLEEESENKSGRRLERMKKKNGGQKAPVKSYNKREK